MKIEVASIALGAMLDHARRQAPDEACGLLLGEGPRILEARPAANVAPDPRRHFEIDPGVLIAAHRAARNGGPRVIGYYHSHPLGPPAPSATDRARAPGDGRVWAIVSGGAVRFWRDMPEGFEPLSSAAIDG